MFNLYRAFCILVSSTLPGVVFADQYTSKALAIIAECYDNAKDIGKELIPCISTRLKQLPESMDYTCIVKLKDAEKYKHNKFSVLIVHKSGFMYYCIAESGQKLVYKTCVSQQGAPTRPGKLLDIDLPD